MSAASSTEPLWVFGYGSLIWNPGFTHQDRQPARLAGAHRSLCVYSHVHRGTEAEPGLVFGLDHGGACRGVAFEVAPADRDEVVAYLRAREQVTSVYLERLKPVTLDGGKVVTALTYVVDRRHRQYAGRLDFAEQLAIVRRAVGRSGRNPDYVLATADKLADLGIRDAGIEALATALRADPTT